MFVYFVTVTFSAVKDMSHVINGHLQAHFMFTGIAFDLLACLLVECNEYRQIIRVMRQWLATSHVA